MALVLFDIDHTLVSVSSEGGFFRYLYTHRMLKWPQWRALMLFTVRYGWRYKETIFKRNKAYLYQLNIKEIENLAARYVQDQLIRYLRSDIAQCLKQHLEAGDEVILLSGTLEMIAKPLAEAVGAQQAVATQCATDEAQEWFTSHVPLLHPFEETKLVVAKQLCEARRVDLQSVVAYGDSIYDLPLLSAVGTPIAVYPSAALRKKAVQFRWKVIG